MVDEGVEVGLYELGGLLIGPLLGKLEVGDTDGDGDRCDSDGREEDGTAEGACDGNAVQYFPLFIGSTKILCQPSLAKYELDPAGACKNESVSPSRSLLL